MSQAAHKQYGLWRPCISAFVSEQDIHVVISQAVRLSAAVGGY